MTERQTATNKLKAQVKETKLVPKKRKAVTLPEDWLEAKVRARQGWLQVVSPEMSAGKSCMTQGNNLAQNKGRVGLIYCG